MGLVASGCAASENEAPAVVDAGGNDAGSPAQVAALYLGLQQPSDGFQVRNAGAEIAAGADTEYCEVAALPGAADDRYYVKSFELGNAAHSHHLIVTAALPGSKAEAALQTLGVGNRVACFGAEQQFGADGFEGVGGSQRPYAAVSFPEGVGREYRGGQLVVFDYHYLNSESEPITAKSAVNFHLTDEAAIEHLARGFSFRNFTINTAARQSASFTGECHFSADVYVGNLTRHTHRWGTDFSVWFAGGARSGEEIWTSNDWEHDVDFTFKQPVLVKASEGFRFRCGYQNDTDRPLRFGTSASDEMCILFGTFWDAQTQQPVAAQGCSIAWVDADGIGHSAYEAGGVPAPSTQQASQCLAASGSNADACARCRCDKCAASAIACALDSECNAILGCYKGCAGMPNCVNRCQETIDAHSSGVGMATQMTQCFESRCSTACKN